MNQENIGAVHTHTSNFYKSDRQSEERYSLVNTNSENKKDGLFIK